MNKAFYIPLIIILFHLNISHSFGNGKNVFYSLNPNFFYSESLKYEIYKHANDTCPGRFVDQRDQKMYSAIKIGNQCWMAENLNIGNLLTSNKKSSDNGEIEKYCFDNNPENCKLYGGLYSWDEIMMYSDKEKKGICPQGWHVPSDNEWMQLEVTLGLNADTVTKFSWRGKYIGFMLFAGNRSGFEATFAGIKSDEGIYSGISNIAIFWSSSKKAPGLMWYRKLKITEQGVFRHYFSTQNACSVRCIKGK